MRRPAARGKEGGPRREASAMAVESPASNPPPWGRPNARRECGFSLERIGGVSEGRLCAPYLLPVRNRRPDIAQSRLFLRRFHLHWAAAVDKLFPMHLVRAPSCKRRGFGGRHDGRSAPQGSAG